MPRTRHVPIGGDVELAEFIDEEAGGGGGGSQTGIESFPFTFEDVQAIWDNGTFASTHLNVSTPNGELVVTAAAAWPGTSGNTITVQFIHDGNDVPLSTSIDGSAITITLAYVAGNKVSTAADVVAEINDGAASDLIAAALASGEDGTGLVQTSGATPLENGVDPSGINFLPLTTGNPGDRIFAAYLNIEESMSNISGGTQLAARLDPEAPATAVAGAQEWDITAAADTVENGVSATTLANSAAAIADTGAYWPLTVTEATAIGVLITDVYQSTPPDAGAVTVSLQIARAA